MGIIFKASCAIVAYGLVWLVAFMAGMMYARSEFREANEAEERAKRTYEYAKELYDNAQLIFAEVKAREAVQDDGETVVAAVQDAERPHSVED